MKTRDILIEKKNKVALIYEELNKVQIKLQKAKHEEAIALENYLKAQYEPLGGK